MIYCRLSFSQMTLPTQPLCLQQRCDLRFAAFKLPAHALSRLLLAVGLLSGYLAATGRAAAQEPQLQVGVVQRFGTQPTDRITLEATAGDRLTLRFQSNDKQETVTSNTVKLDVVMQPLPQPRVDERLVLGTYRSFESAEDQANYWRSQGIPVEVAQPQRWQVWAKRDVYNSPVVRRLLLKSMQAQGNQTAFLDTRTVTQPPRASFIVNGYRYTRDYLEVSAGQGMIQVKTGKQDNLTLRLYAGSLRLQPNTYGTYTLVNQVPVETYLRGVVPHEIGTWATPAVLEVQAILARTYALRNVRRFAIDGYQLCADTQCQVYNGLTGVDPRTDRAIAATQGLVLTYQNELVDAVYSSATGGVTAPFNDVWNGPARPYLQAVIDSVNNQWDLARQPLSDEQTFRRFISQKKGFNEEKDDMFRWREETSLPDLNRQLREYLGTKPHPLANFKTIQRLDVTERSPAGRILKLTATTDAGPIVLEKDNILNTFEAPSSTLFYLEPVFGANRVLAGYAFVGGGFGHGVGLSQTGTYHLGDLGWPSDRILSFYYPGTQLQPFNGAITLWRDPLTGQVVR
jgi:SpoIID/LytB domain protein